MIGIIGAMDEEVVRIKEKMDNVNIINKASMEFVSGLLYGKKAVVVKSGIGKVNAGICTQILADVFNVDAVINTGIAGSLDARIDIGDIVLSEDARSMIWMQWLLDMNRVRYQEWIRSLLRLMKGLSKLQRSAAKKCAVISIVSAAEL